MAVLVTGGNGFIGSNIVKLLLDAGEDVVVFDIRPPDAMNIRFLGARAFEVEQVLAMSATCNWCWTSDQDTKSTA